MEEKPNEITVIAQLLDAIQVKGYIVTIDAMGTQTEIVEKIKQKGADYTLAVKGNQKNLYQEISEYFGDGEFLKEMADNGGIKLPKKKPIPNRNKGELSVWQYSVDAGKKPLERDKEHWDDM